MHTLLLTKSMSWKRANWGSLSKRFRRMKQHLATKEKHLRKVSDIQKKCKGWLSLSTSVFAMKLEETIRRFPKEFRSVDAAVIAEGFLKALGDGYFEEAVYIARLLTKRSEKHFSIIQHRKFTSYVSKHIVDHVPDIITAKSAIAALQALGYGIPSRKIVAILTFLEARERASGVFGHVEQKSDGITMQAVSALQQQRERMRRAGRTFSNPFNKQGGGENSPAASEQSSAP